MQGRLATSSSMALFKTTPIIQKTRVARARPACTPREAQAGTYTGAHRQLAGHQLPTGRLVLIVGLPAPLIRATTSQQAASPSPPPPMLRWPGVGGVFRHVPRAAELPRANSPLVHAYPGAFMAPHLAVARTGNFKARSVMRLNLRGGWHASGGPVGYGR